MEQDLVDRLCAVEAVRVRAGDRVSWFGRQRGDALPALTLAMIAPGRGYSHDGPDGLDRPRVQVDAWAGDPDEARALARAVRDALEDPAVVGATRFWPAELAGEGWADATEQDGGEPLFRISQDFTFFHEAIPT